MLKGIQEQSLRVLLKKEAGRETGLCVNSGAELLVKKAP